MTMKINWLSTLVGGAMRPNFQNLLQGLPAVCGLAAVLGGADMAIGQTWDGQGADDNWSTGLNWDGDVAPVNDGTAALIFSGQTRTTPVADAAWSLASITFDNAATAGFTVTGSDLTFAAGGSVINDSDEIQTIATHLIADASGLTLTANTAPLTVIAGIDLSAAPGATLTIGGSDEVTVSGIITGPGGALVKNDGGVLSLSATNTYSGDTTVTAGVLDITGQVAGNAVVNGGAMIVDGTIAGNATVTGGGLNVIGSVGGDATFNGGTSQIDGTIGGNATVAGGTVAVTGSVTGNATISSGTLTLNGVDAVMGDATLNPGGTLSFGDDDGLMGALTVNGGTLSAANGSRIIDNDLTVAGDFTVGGNQDLTIVSEFDLTADRVVTATNTADSVFSGVISGGFGLTKIGLRSLELSGANTYTGDTTVTDGTLLITGSVAGNAVVGGTGTLIVEGSVGGVTTVNGGTFRVEGTLDNQVELVDGTLSLETDLAFGSTSSLTISGGTLQAAGDNRVIPATVPLIVDGDFEISGDQDLGIAAGFELTQDRTVTVTNSADSEISGVISGVGGLVKAGDEALELSGINTYTGDTSVTEGTLNVSGLVAGDAVVTSGGTLIVGGSIAGDTTVNGGTLALGSDDPDALGGALIIESGNLEAADAPRTITEPLTVNGDFGTTGNQPLTIESGLDVGDGLAINAENTGGTQLAGDVTGTGGLTLTGTGSLELSGENTYQGDTVVNGATLIVTSSIPGDAVISSGTLQVDGSVVGDTTVAGGTLAFGANTDPVSGQEVAATFGGTITIESGNLQANGAPRAVTQPLTITGDFGFDGSQPITIANDPAAAPVNLVLTDDRAITVEAATNAQIDRVIEGGFGLTKLGDGALTLTGVNTYTGTTTVSAGTLALAPSTDGQAHGSIPGDVLLEDTGTLAISSDDAVGGSITILGGNFQAIGGPRTVTNPIILNGNFGVTGDEDLNLASNLTLNGNRTVTVDSTANTEFSGVLSGSGGLIKAGNGSLVLSNTNTYTNDTVVNAGTLIVSGAIAGDALVTNFATLAGRDGTIGGSVHSTGGVLDAGVGFAINDTGAAAGTVGTLNVNGDLTLDSQSFMVVDIVSNNEHDVYDVTGQADLGGTLFVRPAAGYSPRNPDAFTIITADGGVSGEFDDQQVSPPIFDVDVSVDGDRVIVSVLGVPYAATAASPNQRAVARVLDAARPTAEGDQLDVIDALDQLSDPQLRLALDHMVPEELGAVSSVSFNATSLHTGNIASRLAEVRQGFSGSSGRNVRLASVGNDPQQDLAFIALAQNEGIYEGYDDDHDDYGDDAFYPPAQHHDDGDAFNFFVAGAGTFGNVDSSPDQRGYNFFAGQFTIGADQRLNKHMVGGVMLGYDHSKVDVDRDGGDLDINSVRFGLYSSVFGKLGRGTVFLNGFIGGGYHAYDFERRIFVGGLNRTAEADTDGFQLDASFDLGVSLPVRDTRWSVSPIVSVLYSRLAIDSYTESGAGSLNLDVDDQTAHSLRTRAGARLAGQYQIGDTVVIPQLRAMYQNEAEDQSRSVTARFAGGAGGSFGFETTDIGQHSAILGAGVTVVTQDSLSWYVDYSTELGRAEYLAHNIRVGLEVRF